jgi:hypothetical protein
MLIGEIRIRPKTDFTMVQYRVKMLNIDRGTLNDRSRPV